MSPAVQVALNLANQKHRDGNELSVPQSLYEITVPLTIQNTIDAKEIEDRANLLAITIAEALGVNVQTYEEKQEKKGKKKSTASRWN